MRSFCMSEGGQKTGQHNIPAGKLCEFVSMTVGTTGAPLAGEKRSVNSVDRKYISCSTLRFLVSARFLVLENFISVDRSLSRFHNIPLSRDLDAANGDPSAPSTRRCGRQQYLSRSTPR